MRRRTVAILALAVLALRLPGATADDPVAGTGVGARAGEEPFEWCIFPVAAITAGRTEFDLRGEKGFIPFPPDQVNDEENPLFGSEGEESRKPFGTVDDVLELVKAHEPHAFDREGVLISAEGTVGLVVRASRSAQSRIAAYLGSLEREALRTITIDVVAVRGDARAADEGGVEAALACGALVPLGGARGACVVGGVTSARIGTEFTYLQDQDVEVAQDAYISDPIVSVLKGGLYWRGDVIEGVGDRITVRFDGTWAEPGEPDRLTLPRSGEAVERITAKATRAVGFLDLVVGRWTLCEGSGDVAFAVRATVRDDDGTISEPPALGADFPSKVDGEFVWRTIDVGDLAAPSPMRRGRDRRLSPSNYTAPEPPELREAHSRVAPDELIARICLLDPPLCGGDDFVLRRSGGYLVVRAPVAHVEAIERFVAAERRRVVRSLRVRGSVVTLPLAAIPEYLAGLDDGATLVADGGASLLAREGARVVDRASVRLTGSQRVTSDGGRSRSFVADYDVEIAMGAQIGNPIVREVLEGLRFEVDAAYAAEPGALYAEFFIDRSTWLGSRLVPTPSGDIECPTIGISRIRGGALVRAGSPRIVGATLENGVVTLTIVGASLE